jgi:hypothetical protein
MSSKERNRSDNGDKDVEMEVPETPVDETKETKSIEDKVTPRRVRKKKWTLESLMMTMKSKRPR